MCLHCDVYVPLTVPTGPVSGLQAIPSLTQISLSWAEVPADTSTGVVIRYEVQFISTDGSMVSTEYTGSPAFIIKGRNYGADYIYSVTPFSLFARGNTVNQTTQTLSQPRTFLL